MAHVRRDTSTSHLDRWGLQMDLTCHAIAQATTAGAIHFSNVLLCRSYGFLSVLDQLVCFFEA